VIVPTNGRTVSARSISWPDVYNHLADLADAKPNSADYAKQVRTLYDLLAAGTGDAEEARRFLLYQVSAQLHRGLISKQHSGLAAKLLPKPMPQGRRGRTKGALGKGSDMKRYKLYRDWIYEKTLDPSLTKERFAKQRLGITDEDLSGDYSSDHRPKVDALLQELKPARLKHLAEGPRRALELLYPLTILYPRYNLAQKWREAKQHSPALTKEDFLRELFGWPRGRKRHPIQDDIIRDCLERLDHGEKLLTNSERR
jgi:hypothetical protein